MIEQAASEPATAELERAAPQSQSPSVIEQTMVERVAALERAVQERDRSGQGAGSVQAGAGQGEKSAQKEAGRNVQQPSQSGQSAHDAPQPGQVGHSGWVPSPVPQQGTERRDELDGRVAALERQLQASKAELQASRDECSELRERQTREFNNNIQHTFGRKRSLPGERCRFYSTVTGCAKGSDCEYKHDSDGWAGQPADSRMSRPSASPTQDADAGVRDLRPGGTVIEPPIDSTERSSGGSNSRTRRAETAVDARLIVCRCQEVECTLAPRGCKIVSMGRAASRGPMPEGVGEVRSVLEGQRVSAAGPHSCSFLAQLRELLGTAVVDDIIKGHVSIQDAIDTKHPNSGFGQHTSSVCPRWWRQGTCSRGTSCPQLHVRPDEKSPEGTSRGKKERRNRQRDPRDDREGDRGDRRGGGRGGSAGQGDRGGPRFTVTTSSSRHHKRGRRHGSGTSTKPGGSGTHEAQQIAAEAAEARAMGRVRALGELLRSHPARARRLGELVRLGPSGQAADDLQAIGGSIVGTEASGILRAILAIESAGTSLLRGAAQAESEVAVRFILSEAERALPDMDLQPARRLLLDVAGSVLPSQSWYSASGFRWLAEDFAHRHFRSVGLIDHLTVLLADGLCGADNSSQWRGKALECVHAALDACQVTLTRSEVRTIVSILDGIPLSQSISTVLTRQGGQLPRVLAHMLGASAALPVHLHCALPRRAELVLVLLRRGYLKDFLRGAEHLPDEGQRRSAAATVRTWRDAHLGQPTERRSAVVARQPASPCRMVSCC